MGFFLFQDLVEKNQLPLRGGKEAKDLVPVSKLSISYQVLPSDLFGGFK